jgi:hypothetical protein
VGTVRKPIDGGGSDDEDGDGDDEGGSDGLRVGPPPSKGKGKVKVDPGVFPVMTKIAYIEDGRCTTCSSRLHV